MNDTEEEMMVGKVVKGIAIGTLLTCGSQIIQEPTVIENEESKNNLIAYISYPLKNYPPLQDHGPHSQAGIVNTIDEIVAVTTTAPLSFIKKL